MLKNKCLKRLLDDRLLKASYFSVELLVWSSAYCYLGLLFPKLCLVNLKPRWPSRYSKHTISTILWKIYYLEDYIYTVNLNKKVRKMCDLDYSGYHKSNQLMSEIFYSLWYFIFNSHEHAIRSDGEQFSNKRQSTPNVSNDFQCHLMICWNLLET